MAVGGYKSVSFSWQGGRTDTPVERTKFVLNGICDAIISANVGWVLDTLTPTSSDFLQMPSDNTTNYPCLVKVLKLVYDTHTYRLCIGNNYRYIYNTSNSLKPEDCANTRGNDYNYTSQNGLFDGGLFFGLIKDGTLTTNATYGYVWDGQGAFTKWTTFAAGRVQNNSSVAVNSSSVSYNYYFILKNAQIIMLFRCSDWTYGCKFKGFITGELFSTTGHSTDTHTIGTVALSNTINPETTEIYSDYLINASSSRISLQPDTSSGTEIPFQSSIITASGLAYAGAYCTQPYSFIYQPYIGFDTSVIANNISSNVTSPGGRWTPCYMALRAANHDTYYVVPGDGFKGYLDTDLIRGVNPGYGYGQQLDGGNFVYLGGGFAIGWDPNNTVLLF